MDLSPMLFPTTKDEMSASSVKGEKLAGIFFFYHHIWLFRLLYEAIPEPMCSTLIRRFQLLSSACIYQCKTVSLNSDESIKSSFKVATINTVIVWTYTRLEKGVKKKLRLLRDGE